VAQVCKGLHAAHELRDENGQPLGLVHCDVSPQNIMLTSTGTAKLIDFGVARATAGAAAGTNIVTGKLSFMAPEQIRGRDFDRRADLFSLGIVLYLLSTGQHPFPGKTPREIMQRIRVGDSLRPPSQVLPGFPEELERVILKALAHSPNDRFDTAAEMLSALVRAAPERAEEPELAAFVERVCAPELERKRGDIARALSMSPDDTQELAPSGGPPSSRRLPLSDRSASSSSAVPATTVTAPIPTQELRPRRSKARAFALGLFVLALGAGVCVSQLGRLRASWTRDQSNDAAFAARPVAPSAPVSAATSAASENAVLAPVAIGSLPALPVQARTANPTPSARSGAPARVRLPQNPYRAGTPAKNCGGKPCAPGERPPRENVILQRYGI
jgi:serine/threonine-protein kinase